MGVPLLQTAVINFGQKKNNKLDHTEDIYKQTNKKTRRDLIFEIRKLNLVIFAHEWLLN